MRFKLSAGVVVSNASAAIAIVCRGATAVSASVQADAAAEVRLLFGRRAVTQVGTMLIDNPEFHSCRPGLPSSPVVRFCLRQLFADGLMDYRGSGRSRA
jgi:hypothetical protein